MIAGPAVDRCPDLAPGGRGLALAVYVLRNPTLRASWHRVITRPMGMASLAVLTAFVLMGLADFLHYRLKLDNGQYAVEVLSVLDRALRPLKTQTERTYSAPLAARAVQGSQDRAGRQTNARLPAPPIWRRRPGRPGARLPGGDVRSVSSRGWSWGCFPLCCLLAAGVDSACALGVRDAACAKAPARASSGRSRMARVDP